MARSKPRRPLPDMHAQGHKQSHYAPPSERAWEEEPTGIMAQCIAIGDQLVAAAKRTERALRAIGVALTEGEHQFDGPGPDRQADKAEYQRIAEAMFNNLTSDLFPMSAAKTNAGWDDDADRFSEQMEPRHTEMDVEEHQSYLSEEEDQHSDVASASDMPLFADDVDDEPPSAPPSLPDTEQPTLADEPEPEPEPMPELEPEPVSAQQLARPEEGIPVAPSAPAKKRTKKKKKKATKAKMAGLEQTVQDSVDQTQPVPTDIALAQPEEDDYAPDADYAPDVQGEPKFGHEVDYMHGEHDPGSLPPWDIPESLQKLSVEGLTLTEADKQQLKAEVDMYVNVLSNAKLDAEMEAWLKECLDSKLERFTREMLKERPEEVDRSISSALGSLSTEMGAIMFGSESYFAERRL